MAFIRLSVVLLAIFFLGACAGIFEEERRGSVKKSVSTEFDEAEQERVAKKQGCKFLDEGLASWYGYELYGNKTANGEKFQPMGITAAHRTLPFGTMVKVVRADGGGNQDGVFVRINDRGPFKKGRIIDLSKGAAEKLGMPDLKPVRIYTCG
jgi:rare lipoprotein A